MIKVCLNCGARFLDNSWVGSNGELKDPQILSARVCSLSVNRDRIAQCANPFKDSVSPDSSFGYPKELPNIGGEPLNYSEIAKEIINERASRNTL
jgi:hypothetical protein